MSNNKNVKFGTEEIIWKEQVDNCKYIIQYNIPQKYLSTKYVLSKEIQRTCTRNF